MGAADDMKTRADRRSQDLHEAAQGRGEAEQRRTLAQVTDDRSPRRVSH